MDDYPISAPETEAATFCATLVDEWVRSGVTAAFVAPGSRSTPMALALAIDERIGVHVFHDERAASFAALGHGLATGYPAVVLCSSGTAATHFHAAVVEASLSGVPLIACTADRPPELWDIAAPQTIDQTHLYGSAVRHFAEPGVPDAGDGQAHWRPLASRAAAEALGWSGRPGPVHLNLSFRDPLTGQEGPLPPSRPGDRPWHRFQLGAHRLDAQPPQQVVAELAGLAHDGGQARTGVIIAGRGTADPASVTDLADQLGWPVLADHRSGCRLGPTSIRYFDGILRNKAFAEQARPEVVLRFGDPLASKVLSQWLAGCSDARTEIVSLLHGRRWVDPESISSLVVADPGGLAAALAEALASQTGGVVPAGSAKRWQQADEAAGSAIRGVLGAAHTGHLTEIDVASETMAGVAPGGALVVSSSMPVRDVEWFGPARPDIDVYANRGANGIDGVVSTAIGIALTGRPTTVLIGDLALLHDSSALVALRDRRIDLHIVVVDNDGGGIFSFLPQADQIDQAMFEQLFGTPHGTDLVALCRAHGLRATPWPPTGDTGGVRVTVANSGRQANVRLHDLVNQAIVNAVQD